jgi:hypothetical protein
MATAPIKVAGAGPIVFGAGYVFATIKTRYLFVGYSDDPAEITPHQVLAPKTGIVKNLRIIHNILGGNANPITYRVRVNGIATLINVVIPANAASGIDITNTAPVTAGQPIDIEVTKVLSVGSSPRNVVAIVEVT